MSWVSKKLRKTVSSVADRVGDIAKKAAWINPVVGVTTKVGSKLVSNLAGGSKKKKKSQNGSGQGINGQNGTYPQDSFDPDGKWGNVRDSLRNSTIGQSYKYLNRATDINKNLVNDVNKEAGQYGQGTNATGNKYLDAIQNYSNNYNKNLQDYQNNVAQYTGNAGYQNALNQAQMGAAQMAANAGAVAQGNARSNGMSKGAAAALGSGNVINAYNQGLANQQSQVQNNYNNALNTMGNVLNGQGNIYGNMATAAGNRYGSDMSSLNNMFSTMANTRNQAAGNMNNILGQNVANYLNTFNAVYNNQDAVEKLLNGADSGANGWIGKISNGIKWLFD